MVSNEVRKDYLLNRWVVIAKGRNKRPTDFANNNIVEKKGVCPLCPGNEQMTPPSVLSYIFFDGALKKVRDQKSFRHKDWLVRVVPNLYPAFAPPEEYDYIIKKNPTSFRAIGHHEVFIESPRHNEHPGIARVSQIVHLIDAYLD
jgi:UDPglucose--hexose-1-phosphate uridylyltransferase